MSRASRQGRNRTQRCFSPWEGTVAIPNKMRAVLYAGLALCHVLFVATAQGQGISFARQDYAVGTSPQGIAVADLNGDGQLDLAVANEGSNDVSALLGNGDGTFQTARSFAAGSSPRAIAVADLNGDGVPDLAVANERSNDVSVLLGIGEGTFQAARSF